MFKILICEDSLKDHINILFPNYLVDIAKSEEDFLNFTFSKSYDLYIVNFYFYLTLDELKKSGDKAVTIFIDSYYDIYHLKKALLIGDEYLITPVVFEELKARVDYYYRKIFDNLNSILRYKEYFFHLNSKQLFHKTKKIKLSPNEMKLLEIFLCYIDKPVSKDMIYELLESNSDGSLRVYVSKLNKLGFNIVYDRASISYILVL